MGSFAGHVLPGSFFLVCSSWWWLNLLRLTAKTSSTRNRDRLAGAKSTVHFNTWFHCERPRRLTRLPVEPILKVVAASVGILAEVSHGDWTLLNQNRDFVHLNNFSHATMFAVFLICALTEILAFVDAVAVPRSTEHVLSSLAFMVVGTLFYYHVDGRPLLDQLVHAFIYTPAFTLALVLMLEAWQRTSRLLVMIRTVLLAVLGTWFLQAAHILHGAQPWRDTPANQTVVPLLFFWHVTGVILFALVSLIMVKIFSRICGTGPVDSGSAELLDTLITSHRLEDDAC